MRGEYRHQLQFQVIKNYHQQQWQDQLHLDQLLAASPELYCLV